MLFYLMIFVLASLADVHARDFHSLLKLLSFQYFLIECRNNEGPTVFVIKDNDGYIYGGYASQPWERHADFYGDMKSFLFQLYPKASIFRPTGANNNMQWVSPLLPQHLSINIKFIFVIIYSAQIILHSSCGFESWYQLWFWILFYEI